MQPIDYYYLEKTPFLQFEEGYVPKEKELESQEAEEWEANV